LTVTVDVMPPKVARSLGWKGGDNFENETKGESLEEKKSLDGGKRYTPGLVGRLVPEALMDSARWEKTRRNQKVNGNNQKNGNMGGTALSERGV